MKTLGCLFNLFLLTILIAGLIVILHGLHVDILTLLKQALLTLPLAITLGKAYKFHESTVENGGLSINYRGYPVIGIEAYAVSVHKERQVILPLAEFTPQSILAFYHNNGDLLKQPDYLFGTWVDDGKVYLDVSQLAYDLDTALDLAITVNQVAIYHIRTETTIRL